jgi:hypothetical protein
LELPGYEKLPKKPADIAKLVKRFDEADARQAQR